jgi:hypothetical protein
MYWQACLVVLVVAVFYPSSIGHFVWESITSLRSLMGFWSSGLSLKFVEDITHRGDVVIDFGKTSF